jgi:hypothetical protein
VAALVAVVRGRKVVGDVPGQLQGLEEWRREVDRTTARLKHSVDVLSSAVSVLSDEQVELGNARLQPLRLGFAVSELRTEREDTAVRVTGRMINASSLGYRNATFRVKAGTSSAELTIDVLPPGGSGAFSVLLANLPLEGAHVATLSFVSAAVEYAH